MKVIVAGSRTFTDYHLLKNTLLQFMLEHKIMIEEIVSGTAKGADRLGEIFAEIYEIPIKKFIPDWETHGKSAGFKRNSEMADYADMLVVFWDGESKGTKHMIDAAMKKGLLIKIIEFENVTMV